MTWALQKQLVSSQLVVFRTAEDAQAYLAMADELLGAEWADNMHYRFGASSLLTNLLNTLEVTRDKTADPAAY